MRSHLPAWALIGAAISSPAAYAHVNSIMFEGNCQSKSRIGQGNIFQDQWALSHQLAQPFHCDRVMIAAQSANVVWITFYSAAGPRKLPRMTFIGAESSPAGREFDVIGGQAFYGVPSNTDRYAWAGQVTCFIHMRTHYIATAQKITCTAIVHRGSDEKILAAVFERSPKP